jgi:maltooligosyltrehalose trehalohydrolase
MTQEREFRVWAPAAREVTLVVRGAPAPDDATEAAGTESHAMSRSEDGWWSTRVEGAGPLDYAFSVDGGDPLPDPRSPWQPHGVHAFSRTFDEHAYKWADESWRGPREGAGIPGAVIYEMHIGTFTPAGTFAAAVEHLDHLVTLGVDVVQVLPVAAFPGRWGWGYDGVDLYAVHDAYGGPAAFQAFVDACHGRGLGVCLDVVYNHLGPDGNYLGSFGPYFTDRHTTPWGAAVNLDAPGSLEVRRFIVENALRWFEDFHVDALRLDAVHELQDSSATHILTELADATSDLSGRLGRPLELIAESDLNDPVMVTPTHEGGRGMTAQWADDVHHALHVALTGERQGYYADFAAPGVLAKTLREVFLHDGSWSSFRGAHWGAKVDPDRHDGRSFVGYLQTHDQVGNRAVGDRISANVAPEQQAAAAALYLLSAFTPMIFMGEEWAAATPWQFFSDFESPRMQEAVRTGRRAEFAAHGWAEEDVPDPQDPATREASVLDWGEPADADHARMLAWYRELIALRRTEPSFTDGKLDTVEVSDFEGALSVRRQPFLVAVNLAATPAQLPLPADQVARVALAFDPSAVQVTGESVELGAHASAVLRLY